MTDANVPIRAVVFTMHGETVPEVRLVDVSDSDHLVSLRFGDDRSGISLVGQLDNLHRLIVEADRQLSHLAEQ
jgi:hypothetical protein